MQSPGVGNGKPPRYTCHENLLNCIKRLKDTTPKDESPRLEGIQYATKEEWRDSYTKNEQSGSKRKQCLVVDVSCGKSEVWCYKEQYCIGTWNVRSLDQGKLDVAMYGCESWTIKKAEPCRIDAFELWCWGRLLKVSWMQDQTCPS